VTRGPVTAGPVTVDGAPPRRFDLPDRVSVLAPFVDAGMFDSYEVQLASTVRRLQPDVTDEVILALAIAARAPRFGHVRVGLDPDRLQAAVSDDHGLPMPALPWPTVSEWATALEGSPVVATPADAGGEPVRPLVWDGGQLYLQRYWHYEVAVAGDLARRAVGPAAGPAEDPDERRAAIETTLDVLFGEGSGARPDLQRMAARRGMRPGVSIIAGGPGTGKTHTVARLLVAAHLVAEAGGHDLQVALAAPTGKAAARMGEAVQAEVRALGDAGVVTSALADAVTASDPTTVHTLLGWKDRTRFRHDGHHPLPHDLVVIDETSMVSLPLMAKLLDAVRPEARLVLVGDPFQLASIEAGTVMSDIVGPAGAVADVGGPAHTDTLATTLAAAPVLDGRVTVLRHMHRFDEDSTIAALAESVRTGDAERAISLLDGGSADVQWIDPDDRDAMGGLRTEVVVAGVEMVSAALSGDAVAALAAANRVKVLAATRRGPGGVNDWTERVESAVAAAVPAFGPSRRWHVGRPVMVTANDGVNRVFNGDVGVVVAGDPGMEVAFGDEGGIRVLAPSRLDRVETWWAMTIHKSQGSEFDHAIVSLPDAGSPILTRELLYTGVTRARRRLTVVGSEASLRAAIARPVSRASGLRDRLWAS
jgi:exodeoxyribonuclease V alpha subunit